MRERMLMMIAAIAGGLVGGLCVKEAVEQAFQFAGAVVGGVNFD